MKKNLLSILFSIFWVVVSAQTNLNFETWSANEPAGWVTYNFLSAIGAPQSTFKETTDPGENLASVKMVTVNCPTCPTYGLPSTLGGVVTSGTIGPPPALGVAYAGRPTSIDFQYKANPVAGDAGIVFVQLSRWDSDSALKVIIGQGYLLANAQVSSWTSYTVMIQYANADTPDSLMIMASSSAASAVQGLPGSGTPALGSEFYLDSIVINDPCASANLTVTVTGTNETVAGANDGTALASASGGSAPFTYVWNTGGISPTVSGLAPGTYTVAVIDANGCATSGSYTVLAGSSGIISAEGNSLISVYPVPGTKVLFFQITLENADAIFISDIAGKNILTEKISDKLTSVSLETFPEGIYFYQVKNKNSVNLFNGKFTVIK